MKKKGFTLIELMIVIAIIAVLTGIVLASLNTARAKSRDSRRISDVKQLQLAVENYFDNNNMYPSSLSDLSPAILPIVPTDPSDPSRQYAYNTNSSHNQYCIGTNLEVTNSSVVSGACNIPGGSWVPDDPTDSSGPASGANPYIVTGP